MNFSFFGILHDIDDCQIFKEGPYYPVFVQFKICRKSRVLFWPLRTALSLVAQGPTLLILGMQITISTTAKIVTNAYWWVVEKLLCYYLMALIIYLNINYLSLIINCLFALLYTMSMSLPCLYYHICPLSRSWCYIELSKIRYLTKQEIAKLSPNP